MRFVFVITLLTAAYACADDPPSTTESALDDVTRTGGPVPYPIGSACHVSYYSNGSLLYTVSGTSACCPGGCGGTSNCCLIGLGETTQPQCYYWGTNAGACPGF